MSNPYYVYNDDYVPGGRIRSRSLDEQFEAIEAGFALLADPSALNNGSTTFSNDTGTANNVVVDTGTGGTLNPGQIVVFIPDNTNTGPTVISVNGNGNEAIVRNDGQPLQPGDITDGIPVMVIYDDVNNRWVLVGATPVQALGRPTIHTKTSDYTVTLSDEADVILVNASADVTITIPQGLPVGYLVHVYRFGSGEVTLAPASGVVRRSAIGPSARVQYSSISAMVTADNEFMVLGDAK